AGGCPLGETLAEQRRFLRSREGAATELLLRKGLGRPPQAEETHAARLPGSAEAIERMAWAEMTAVFAAAFVTEIDYLERFGRREAGSRSGGSPLRGHAQRVARGA